MLSAMLIGLSTCHSMHAVAPALARCGHHRVAAEPPRAPCLRTVARMSLVEVIPSAVLPASADAKENLQSTLLKIAVAESDDEVALEGGVDELHRNLERAGFELMSECDSELAATLQPTALERLCVRAQLSNFDTSLADDILTHRWSNDIDGDAPLLYDGRVLLWRRHYGSEQRKGRFVLAKLDYLQQALVTNLVVGPAFLLAASVRRLTTRAGDAFSQTLERIAPSVKWSSPDSDADLGSFSSSGVSCPMTTSIARTSIADAFDGVGASKFLSVLFGSSALSEPTYAELVVAWRRPPPPAAAQLRAKARVGIPAILDAVDENNDGKLSLGEITEALTSPERIREAAKQAIDEQITEPPPPPLELRLYREIPIANFELALPDSKPRFGFSDWLRLDLVSSPALLAVLSSPDLRDRFNGDLTYLDVAAASAIIVWIVRTFLIYRNTLINYQLLLNRFLTEKLSIRDGGEVRMYAAREARKEQARRGAALLASIREQPHPRTAEEIIAAACDAERVELRPALDELQRLGLVCACERPLQSEHATDEATADGGRVVDASTAEVLLEAAPDGDSKLSEHWRKLLTL